jgi:TonB-dependent receptor
METKLCLKSWRGLLAGLAVFLVALPAVAQDAATGSAGVVTGRVLNPVTKRYLNNAVVRVEGTNLTAVTDQDGNYRLAGVAPGAHKIIVEYEDLDTTSATVTVRPGVTVTKDFDLKSNIYQLEAFVVAGDREGQAAATQAQRAAVEGQYVMAADSFGNIQDGNIGELLRQLPGITVFDTSSGGGFAAPGEASSIRIRGATDDMAAMITIDGNSATSTNPVGAGGRDFSLKGFIVDNIESVEVFKAATPAHPGNSLGGLVNFTTKSAFQQKGRRVGLDFQFKFLAEDFGLGSRPLGSAEPARKFYPNVSLRYSEAFRQNTAHPVGIVFSFTAAQTGRTGVRNSSAFNDFPTRPFGQPFDMNFPSIGRSASWEQEDWLTNTLQSALTVDYKVTFNSTFSVKFNWVDQRQVDGGSRSVMANALSRDAGSTHDTAVAIENVSNYLRVIARDFKYDSSTFSVNPGMKHKWGGFSLGYDVYYSKSDMDRNEAALNYFLGGNSTHDASHRVGFTLRDLTSVNGATFIPAEGVDVSQIGGYDSLTLITRDSDQHEKKYGGKVDVKQAFLFQFPIILQTGAAHNVWEQKSLRPTSTYEWAGEDFILGTPDDPGLATFEDYAWKNAFYWNDKAPNVPWLSPEKVRAYYNENPSSFNPRVTPDNGSNWYNMLVNQKRVKEEVTAWYFQGTWGFGPFNILAGARWERTKATLTGYVYEAYAGRPGTADYIPDGEDRSLGKMTRTTKGTAYDNWLPGVHLKYEPVKSVQFRGSVTRSIGRPPVNNLLPLEIVDLVSIPIRITQSNPDLMPQEGKNYDFSGEWYYNRNSYVGFSLYRKEQKNRSRQVELILGAGPDNGYDGAYEGAIVTTWRSQGKVNIEGFELVGSHVLQFLPWKLKNMRFLWNYSHTKGKTKDTAASNWQNIIDGSPRFTANAALFYQGKRVAWQLKYNWVDEQTIDTQYWAGTDIMRTRRRYSERKILDFGGTYKLTSRWGMYFDWRNITNEDQWTWGTLGDIDHMKVFTNITVGLRANF